MVAEVGPVRVVVRCSSCEPSGSFELVEVEASGGVPAFSVEVPLGLSRFERAVPGGVAVYVRAVEGGPFELVRVDPFGVISDAEIGEMLAERRGWSGAEAREYVDPGACL